jgi:hypothetical protein
MCGGTYYVVAVVLCSPHVETLTWCSKCLFVLMTSQLSSLSQAPRHTLATKSMPQRVKCTVCICMRKGRVPCLGDPESAQAKVGPPILQFCVCEGTPAFAAGGLLMATPKQAHTTPCSCYVPTPTLFDICLDICLAGFQGDQGRAPSWECRGWGDSEAGREGLLSEPSRASWGVTCVHTCRTVVLLRSARALGTIPLRDELRCGVASCSKHSVR